MQHPPAYPGMPEDEIDTPALVVDMQALEANIVKMAQFCAEAGIGLRPHAKTHKSPVIANWQIARGAVGQCVQKTAEAEILAWGGVSDILVSNEVVSDAKLRRLAGLTRMSRIALCADDTATIARIESAAADLGTRLGVLVEIEVGSNRCGVDTPAEAVALAQRIAGSRHLVFKGLQAYDGAAQHIRTLGERRRHVGRAIDKAGQTIAALADIGLDCEIVGGGGTGSFEIEAQSGVYTELQAGSYLFMDADYGRNTPAPNFQQSLFVLTTVMSAARSGRAIVDCGHKAVPIDSGLPLVFGRNDAVCDGMSDEHGHLTLAPGSDELQVGSRLRLVPGHCDPVVNCHDWYVGVRNGYVEAVWPVAARGALG